MSVKTMQYEFTDEEWAAAEFAYREDVKQMYEDGYMGDFGIGLAFAIDTYGVMCWAKYFPHREFDSAC